MIILRMKKTALSSHWLDIFIPPWVRDVDWRTKWDLHLKEWRVQRISKWYKINTNKVEYVLSINGYIHQTMYIYTLHHYYISSVYCCIFEYYHLLSSLKYRWVDQENMVEVGMLKRKIT